MFDRAFHEILDTANKDRNSLFRKILPITLCESIFCERNQRLAYPKYFRSKILGEEIQKNTLSPLRGLTPPNALPRLPV